MYALTNNSVTPFSEKYYLIEVIGL